MLETHDPQPSMSCADSQLEGMASWREGRWTSFRGMSSQVRMDEPASSHTEWSPDKRAMFKKALSRLGKDRTVHVRSAGKGSNDSLLSGKHSKSNAIFDKAATLKVKDSEYFVFSGKTYSVMAKKPRDVEHGKPLPPCRPSRAECEKERKEVYGTTKFVTITSRHGPCEEKEEEEDEDESTMLGHVALPLRPTSLIPTQQYSPYAYATYGINSRISPSKLQPLAHKRHFMHSIEAARRQAASQASSAELARVKSQVW